MFVTSLVVFLALMVQYPSFRKKAPFLILIGFFEFIFSIATMFMVGLFTGIATTFAGFLVPAAYALKRRLSKNQFKILTFSGCLELAVGAVGLYYRLLVGADLPMVLLIAVGSCSLTIGLASFFIGKPEKSPSKPKDHKANLAVVALIIVISIAFFLQYDFATKTTTINYSLDTNAHSFYHEGNNSINITCHNGDDRGASFYLVLELTNASFSNQTEPPYIQETSTTVKFPFTLRSGDSMVKPVLFSIDGNATGFSFFVSFEKIGQNMVYGQSLWYSVSYRWNEAGEYYDQWIIGGAIV